MKIFTLLVVLLFTSFPSAFAQQCIQKDEAESIVIGVAKGGVQYIENISSEKVKRWTDFSALRKNEDIIKLSTEVVYRKKSSIKTNSTEVISIIHFPENKECVQLINMRLPNELRGMCDDQGLLAILLTLKRLMGKLK